MSRWRAEYDDGIWRFYRDGMELGLYEKGDVVIDALNNAESRIAELKAKNNQYIKLIQDWVDVFDPRYPQGDSLASAVRLAMIESIDETPEAR